MGWAPLTEDDVILFGLTLEASNDVISDLFADSASSPNAGVPFDGFERGRDRLPGVTQVCLYAPPLAMGRPGRRGAWRRSSQRPTGKYPFGDAVPRAQRRSQWGADT